MKKSTLLRSAVLAGAAAVCSTSASAQETQAEVKEADIIVTASRSGDSVPRSLVAASVSVIDSEDIEQRQIRQISDVLRDVPGIAVNEVAGLTQLRLRGAEGNHTLILIDGIEVASPFYGEFDFGTLIADEKARIEVLRGQQSALYGSDAIGGVIDYRTMTGAEAPGFFARAEVGTFESFAGAARFGGKSGAFDYVLTSALTSTDGTPNARGGTRNIGRDSASIGFIANAEASDGLSFSLVARYAHNDGEFNNSDFDATSPNFGLTIDSPGTNFENRSVFGRFGAELDPLDGKWTHRLSVQFANTDRRTFSGGAPSSGNRGERLKGSYETTLKLESGPLEHRLTAALDIERERFRNDDPSGFAFAGERQVDNLGLVAQYELLASDKASFSAAIRHDDNDLFANATTYRVQGAYWAGSDTRVHAAYGTGIKNPGFYQLYGFVDGRFIGNPNLTPEESEGWEAGLIQEFAGDQAKLGLTYFSSRLKGEIFTTFPAPDFIATPANRTSLSKRKGVETWLEVELDTAWKIDASYTYLHARENGVEEVRRPDHIASAALNWQSPDNKTGVTLVGRYNGVQQDFAFTDPSFVPVTVRLDDYILVNLNARRDIGNGLQLFGRVENLFDENYEQVFSFVSPGISAHAGIRGSF